MLLGQVGRSFGILVLKRNKPCQLGLDASIITFETAQGGVAIARPILGVLRRRRCSIRDDDDAGTGDVTDYRRPLAIKLHQLQLLMMIHKLEMMVQLQHTDCQSNRILSTKYKLQMSAVLTRARATRQLRDLYPTISYAGLIDNGALLGVYCGRFIHPGCLPTLSLSTKTGPIVCNQARISCYQRTSTRVSWYDFQTPARFFCCLQHQQAVCCKSQVTTKRTPAIVARLDLEVVCLVRNP